MKGTVFRLLHSPGLVTVGLSLGYEIWPQISWHHPSWLVGLNIGWDCHISQCIMDSCDGWEFPLFSKGHWQSPCTAIMAGICLLLGLCKETVKESSTGGQLCCARRLWKSLQSFSCGTVTSKCVHCYVRLGFIIKVATNICAAMSVTPCVNIHGERLMKAGGKNFKPL